MIEMEAKNDLVRDLEWLYDHSGVGCCLHIVTDDYNVEDDDVIFCVGFAKEQAHHDCAALAEKLLALSVDDRWALLEQFRGRPLRELYENDDEQPPGAA